MRTLAELNDTHLTYTEALRLVGLEQTEQAKRDFIDRMLEADTINATVAELLRTYL